MKNLSAFLVDTEKIELRECSYPTINDNEVLVKISAVGICGSDLHYYTNGRIGDFIVKYPFILGHECSGTIVETGINVFDLKVGDRVVLEPGVGCGTCELCLSGHYNLCKTVKFFATPPYNGCLCEYISHPASFTYKMPDSMTFSEGALVEPLAIGINAALTGGVKLGDTVLIYGAGCIGLVSLLACSAYGATKIIVIDILDNRLSLASEMGAMTINSGNSTDIIADIMNLTENKGVDVLIDCVGINSTLCQSVEFVKSGGTIVWVGLSCDKINGLPLMPICTKELTIKSIFRYKNLFKIAIESISSGKTDVKKIVSNTFKFDDVQHAFDYTNNNSNSITKSIVVM